MYSWYSSTQAGIFNGYIEILRYPIKQIPGNAVWPSQLGEVRLFKSPTCCNGLKTHITSTDKVDYKSADVNAFIRIYRKAYHADPTDFAIKGFRRGALLRAAAGARR
jgi:hypothetical protein